MNHYRTARLTRDPRFDGKFFVAVKTTNIYCRSICPAPAPKEKNVSYFETAIAAQEAGYRPCLRCRPESAPDSAAWAGNQALLKKALTKIQSGALNHSSLAELSQSMGISDRYLRQLFEQYLGVSPSVYANHLRLMFAKQLLHQTSLPITAIAYSSGFSSIRRFNDSFKKLMNIPPSALRKAIARHRPIADNKSPSITLKLSYRPPYNWPLMKKFLKQRELSPIETVGDNSYSRTFYIDNCQGFFSAAHYAEKHCFEVKIEISDASQLMAAVAKVRKLLDLNTDVEQIESHLSQDARLKPLLQPGLRLPACWDGFEAGVKAILGQQVSVKAAYGHTQKLIEHLGESYNADYKLFPTPQQVANSGLDFLHMPGSRKDTLRTFAKWYHQDEGHDLNSLIDLKGIGPWTVEYIKLRSGEDSDAFPAKDLGVLKALKQYHIEHTDHWQPWRSYATLHLWHSL